MKPSESILRLRQKHAPRPPRDANVDAAALLAAQSVSGAFRGALLASAILITLWIAAGMLFDQYFPWFSVIQGFFVGRAVQHFGRGIDWRFPLLAAAVAIVAAFVGSFLCALFLTGREFDTGVLSLATEVSWYTLRTFASSKFAVVGSIYAAMAAAIAAFFAQRRLDRGEALALRKHQQAEEK